jgi:hypothetical protein
MLFVLDEAAERMPYLTNIEVEQRIPAPRINAWYARIVPKLRHLKVFKVMGHLEGDVFSKLAELPSLRYIRGVYGSRQEVGTELPRNLPTGSFSALSSLKLTVGLAKLGHALDCGRFEGLQMLSLQTPCWESDHSLEKTRPADLRVFLCQLASTCDMIHNVSLDLQMFITPLAVEHIECGDQITIFDITPLFQVSTIRRFQLSHDYPLLIVDKDLIRVGKAWPMLECLKLNEEPCSFKRPALKLGAMEMVADLVSVAQVSKTAVFNWGKYNAS